MDLGFRFSFFFFFAGPFPTSVEGLGFRVSGVQRLSRVSGCGSLELKLRLED